MAESKREEAQRKRAESRRKRREPAAEEPRNDGAAQDESSSDEPLACVVMRSGQSRGEADLRQFTGSALAMLERRLQHDGIVAEPGSPKTISLRVKDMSVIPSAFIVRVVLTVEAELGDGARRAFRTRDGSPDAQRALDSAIALALSELVSDEQFIAYVNGR